MTRTAGAGPTNPYLCVGGSCTHGGSGTSYSSDTIAAAGPGGNNQLSFKVGMPSTVATPVDATYLVELVSTIDRSVKATWTVRVTRLTPAVTVAPSFSFVDMAAPMNATADLKQPVTWGGTINTPTTFKVTRTAGSGPTNLYLCIHR